MTFCESIIAQCLKALKSCMTERKKQNANAIDWRMRCDTTAVIGVIAPCSLTILVGDVIVD